MYIDGELHSEAHDLDVRPLLEVSKERKIIDYTINECDHNWLLDEGGLPFNIKNVRIKV